jgi:hypothetical protein
MLVVLLLIFGALLECRQVSKEGHIGVKRTKDA